MLLAYPACFYKEKDGGYSVIFPDLNHLATCGDTLEEALSMAVDCLTGYLYSEDDIPIPSDPKSINPDEEYDDYEEVFIDIVTVDIDKLNI